MESELTRWQIDSMIYICYNNFHGMKINRVIEGNIYNKTLALSMSYNITDHLVASPKHGMKITTDSQT